MSSNNDNTESDEAVSQFLALTGSSDASQAQTYLEMSANSIETAVNLYFEHQSGGGGGLGSTTAAGGGTTRNTTSSTSTSANFGVDDVRAPDQTRTMRLMDFEGPPTMMGVGGGGDMAGLLNHPVLGPHAAAMMNSTAVGGMIGNDTNAAAAAADQMMAQMSVFADDIDDAMGGIARTGNVRDMINASTSTNNEGGGIGSGNGSTTGENGDDEGSEVQITGSFRPNSLNDLFAQPRSLMHTAGGFQGARNVAKNARRWLLVNLQNDSDFSCHALNRDVWRDELVENLVRSGYIFWQEINTAQEGRTYAQRYNVTSYPHIAIIDPRTARLMYRKEGWTQENPLTAAKFAELAADFCSQNSFDKPPSIPRGERNVSSGSGSGSGTTTPAVAATVPSALDRMTEEEQLQAAIRASMNEASGLKSTTHSNDDDEDDDDDNEVMHCDDDEDEYEYIDDDDNDNNDIANLKSEEHDEAVVGEKMEVEEVKEITFHDEIIAMDVGDEPDGTNGVARIMIRMPDGKRLVRKFKLEDTVKILYAFVAQSNDDAKGGKEFELKAGFPPKNLISMIDDTFKSCGLAGESVTVRWKED